MANANGNNDGYNIIRFAMCENEMEFFFGPKDTKTFWIQVQERKPVDIKDTKTFWVPKIRKPSDQKADISNKRQAAARHSAAGSGSTTMMFSALIRSALPPLRSASSHTPSFAARSIDYGRTSLSYWFNNIRSPLVLMNGIREKSCLQTNKSAAKRFIVRGNGRIKR